VDNVFVVVVVLYCLYCAFAMLAYEPHTKSPSLSALICSRHACVWLLSRFWHQGKHTNNTSLGGLCQPMFVESVWNGMLWRKLADCGIITAKSVNYRCYLTNEKQRNMLWHSSSILFYFVTWQIFAKSFGQGSISFLVPLKENFGAKWTFGTSSTVLWDLFSW